MHQKNTISHLLLQYYIIVLVAFVFYLLFYTLTTTLNFNVTRLFPNKRTSTNQSSPSPFFVNTPHCKISYVDPFSTEVLAIYHPPKYETCTNESDIVTPKFDTNLRRYVLHINDTIARQLMNSSTEEYNCIYAEINRANASDTYINTMTKIKFTHKYVVPVHVEGMIVQCSLVANTSQELQTDAFFLVQRKFPEFLNREPVRNQEAPKAKDPLRKPSVIMFGIDALSRINFRRTMPKVYEHMRQRGWYELQGYNKIGDNTLPNLLAILSGYDSTKSICNITKEGCLDDFPIIWKDFKNAGYLTAYAEDETFMSTFNYLQPGFRKQPTDFYFRPFMKAIEDYLNVYKKNGKYCIGRRVTCTYIYDFCRHFMQQFANERPIFGLFWSNHFSHDDWQMPAVMSEKILQYLIDFEEDGAMDSNIIIFLSDHGRRYGKILDLPEGFLDERLPMMFIWLPKWFRDQYPEYAEALEVNRNRLTSNYDIYMTLKHIIQLGTPYNMKAKPAFNCPKCQSVFYPVPENRTCSDAGIMDHWCTCIPFKDVSKLNYTHVIPYLVADRMNEYLAAKNLSRLCSKLKPRKVIRIDRKSNLNNKGENIKKEVNTYRITFIADPKGPKFQATVLFNNRTKVVDVNVKTITRLTSYKNDSPCINDKEAKKYCVCYSSIVKKMQTKSKI